MPPLDSQLDFQDDDGTPMRRRRMAFQTAIEHRPRTVPLRRALAECSQLFIATIVLCLAVPVVMIVGGFAFMIVRNWIAG
jgi:hypothetical protein